MSKIGTSKPFSSRSETGGCPLIRTVCRAVWPTGRGRWSNLLARVGAVREGRPWRGTAERRPRAAATANVPKGKQQSEEGSTTSVPWTLTRHCADRGARTGTLGDREAKPRQASPPRCASAQHVPHVAHPGYGDGGPTQT
jgi:hypothetical protein